MKRNEKGQFIKGFTGNAKGRPKRKTEDKYLKALRDSVTSKEWKAICKRAIKDAKGGNNQARQWLSDYLLGKPVQELRVDARTDLTIILGWDDADAEHNSTEAP